MFIVYVLPALSNYYGKLFSVAELLAYGYATFLRNGGRMSSYPNIAYYTHPGACLYSTIFIDYFFISVFLHYIDMAQGSPMFNAPKRIFAAAIRSSFQSSFQSECGGEDDAKGNHKQPPPYNDNLNKFSEEKKNYYKKPIQQSQRYYPSKHTTYFIKIL